jgi:hypothetical protein
MCVIPSSGLAPDRGGGGRRWGREGPRWRCSCCWAARSACCEQRHRLSAHTNTQIQATSASATIIGAAVGRLLPGPLCAPLERDSIVCELRERARALERIFPQLADCSSGGDCEPSALARACSLRTLAHVLPANPHARAPCKASRGRSLRGLTRALLAKPHARALPAKAGVSRVWSAWPVYRDPSRAAACAVA